MSASQSTIQKRHLAKGESYSIDLFVKDKYSHSIHISLLHNGKLLQTLALDPTDNMIAGSISQQTLDALGTEANDFLQVLSKTLLEKLGAKEFILVPEGQNLNGFNSPENTRFRHCDTLTFRARTDAVLKQYPELLKQLNEQYHFVTDEKTLMTNKDVLKEYQKINTIMEKADFTPGKMDEYKNEELQGKMSRFKNEFVRPMVMLDAKENVVGLVRILLMGNQFSYLSDEVINQDIISQDKFLGKDENEKKENRSKFLLAFLMNKACHLGLHNFIIAARGREHIYEEIGFEKFPLKLAGWKPLLSLTPPAYVLKDVQENIKGKSLLRYAPLLPIAFFGAWAASSLLSKSAVSSASSCAVSMQRK